MDNATWTFMYKFSMYIFFPFLLGIYIELGLLGHMGTLQETQVQFLGWKDPQEKGMAICPSILAWEISWTKKPGELQFMRSQRVGHNWVTFTFTYWNSMCKVLKDFQTIFKSHCKCFLKYTVADKFQIVYDRYHSIF